MSFAQLKVVFGSLRFRLMLWNAVVMLIASMTVLWGLREGVRYSLVNELDQNLREDFSEISLGLVNVFEASNRRLHAQMDRKARGHVQRSWFVQFVDWRQFAATTDMVADPQSEPSQSQTPLVDDLTEAKPRLIWQTYNAPDWAILSVPPDFDRFILPDGVPTTVDHYRVLEQTVADAIRGPIRVRVGASMRSIQHASAITDRLLLFNVFISLVIAPLGGYYLALQATRPLNLIIRTVDRLRPEQMSERLPVFQSQDEIDQLSVSFNRLLDRVAEYLIKRQDFLANSAHELRTPLAALRTTAELALSSQHDAASTRDVLESIVTECGSLEQLVNQLLLLAEADLAHFELRGEQVDFSGITSESCDMFGAVAESRGLVLHTSIQPGITVQGSRLHLRQLLNNLIDNAIKFIPAKGQVDVELKSTPGGQQLVVRDTGVGIAAEEQGRLFERFYRGDPARRRDTPTRGTGLGLSISKAITEAHGGAISVRSEPGVGTEVTVLLPKPGAIA